VQAVTMQGGERSGLRRYVSVLDGVRPYQRGWLQRDIVAGITLAALAIPEVMGYAKIAGMPVLTGLYTILIPIVAFALFGSSRHLVVGADSATAAIMFGGIAGLGTAGLQPATPRWVALAGLSALLAGGLLWLARLARLGFLADFLARTVLVGFLSGVGVQVATSQLGGMLGIPKQPAGVPFFSDNLVEFFNTLGHIGQLSWPTALVSASVLAVLVGFERWAKAIPGGLVAVVGSIVASWALDLQAHHVSTLGPVPSGLPSIALPSGVSWQDATRLLPTAASLFLVILAQSAATSRAYAAKHNERVEENTDLVGLGLANLTAGLSGGFVVNGSPTKTAIVDQANSHTQVAQLTTAVMVAIVLLLSTRPLQYLPNAVLSSVVFLLGVQLVAVTAMRRIYRLRRDEFWVALVTAMVVVAVGVEQGIVLAIVLSLIVHVKRHVTPPQRGRALGPAGTVQAGQAHPWRGQRARPGHLPVRRRYLLRQCGAPRRGGHGPGERPRSAALVGAGRRRDRRRRLHRRADPPGAGRPAAPTRGRLRGCRGQRRHPSRTRSLRAHRQDRPGPLLRQPARRPRRLPPRLAQLRRRPGRTISIQHA
jgi:sulfate permease, SulP family